MSEFGMMDKKYSNKEREQYELMNQLLPPSEETYDNEKRVFARKEIEYDNLVHAMNIYEFYESYDSGLFTPYDGYGKLVIVGDSEKHNIGIDAIDFCKRVKETIGILGYEKYMKFMDFYNIVYNHLHYKVREYGIVGKPGIFVAWYNK